MGSVIKLGVEGCEAELLHGAEKTLSAFHPVIMPEIWKTNLEVVMPILEGHGYCVQPISLLGHVAACRPER